jgi:hypothetical protein
VGEIVDCELLENIVRGGLYASAGTLGKGHTIRGPCTRRAFSNGAAILPAFVQVPCMLDGRD